MQIVKAIEAEGQQNGRPKKRVVIVDCGELPSKRMILKKLREEKEQLANLKKDPIQVQPPPFPGRTSFTAWENAPGEKLQCIGRT